jgi:hypothetical protein
LTYQCGHSNRDREGNRRVFTAKIAEIAEKKTEGERERIWRTVTAENPNAMRDTTRLKRV